MFFQSHVVMSYFLYYTHVYIAVGLYLAFHLFSMQNLNTVPTLISCISNFNAVFCTVLSTHFLFIIVTVYFSLLALYVM
jgi:hypothetical protein